MSVRPTLPPGITNNLCSLAYSAAVLLPPLRAALGIPPVPTQAEAAAAGAGMSSQAAPTAAESSESVLRARLAAARSLASVGETMLASGDAQAAAKMLRRGHATCVEAVGASAAESLTHLLRLAEVSEEAGLRDEAIAAYRQWEMLSSAPPADEHAESVAARIARLEQQS